jgi:hypothetical protein
VPLSEEELRLLEQMERALVAEDPKLASTMRGTTLRAAARRSAVMQVTVVGIIGFVVMLGSAYVALSSWHGQSRAAEQPAGQSGEHPTFSVIDGGRTKKKGKRSPRNRSQSHGSMMQRFEERWRRRRDQNGY